MNGLKAKEVTANGSKSQLVAKPVLSHEDSLLWESYYERPAIEVRRAHQAAIASGQVADNGRMTAVGCFPVSISIAESRVIIWETIGQDIKENGKALSIEKDSPFKASRHEITTDV